LLPLIHLQLSLPLKSFLFTPDGSFILPAQILEA
jgi:hypothetical protein